MMSTRRADLRFRSGDADCAATLYQPRVTPARGSPCVVMCNGYSLTRRDGLEKFAERFAAAGFAALAFDFRHLGDSGGTPRQLIDHRRQRTDLAAAVASARRADGIDPARIALWGFSQGGGLVLQAAADPTIVAAVTLFPMVDGLAFALAGNPVTGARLLAAAVRDQFGKHTVRVPVVGPPGSIAVLDQPAAQAGVGDVVSDGSLWRNEVCARSFLTAAFFRPVRAAPHVHCPLLVGLAENDGIVPARPILRAVNRATNGNLKRYPLEHLDALKDGTRLEEVAADHVAFFTQVLR